MRINLTVPRPNVPGDRCRYPYDRLGVGDEFFVPVQRASPLTVREMVRRRMAKHPGAAYSVVEVNGGSLVTRVA